MGITTFTGPIKAGDVIDTTGTTVGTNVANTGNTIVEQTFKKDYTGLTTAGRTDTVAVLPAGSIIVDIKIDTLVAFTGSTAANMTLGDGTTANLFWASTDITSQGRLAYTNAATKLANWFGAATTAAPACKGIGATDVAVRSEEHSSELQSH